MTSIKVKMILNTIAARIVCVCLSVSETLNGERDTFAKNVATFRRSDPLEESIDDRRDRPMIDRRWIEDLTLGLIRN